MIKLNELKIKADIELEPGLYVTNKISSCGKTYLCEILKAYRNIGYRVNAFTYYDLRVLQLKDALNIEKYDLVFLDRYDMYKDLGHEYIKAFADNGGIVILDCKEELDIDYDYNICNVDIVNEYTVEVDR